MVLDRYRKAADWFLVPVASRMLRVNPNVVSWIAFLAAVGAGISFFIGGGGVPRPPPLLILAHSYPGALRGKNSEKGRKASRGGGFFGHVLVRYADGFLVGGIAFYTG